MQPFVLNYQKRKYENLAQTLARKPLSMSSLQSYVPIYRHFFALNNSNHSLIHMNHKWFLHDIDLEEEEDENEEDEEEKEEKEDEKENEKDDDDTEEDGISNTLYCTLKNKDNNKTVQKEAFVKFAPLIDPFKYLIGKYNSTDPHLFNLPNAPQPSQSVHPKITNPHNSAYVDGFFYFLCSQALHQHNMFNAVDFYGTFLGIKHNFKVDIADDLHYLVNYPFFKEHQGKLFQVEDFSYLFDIQHPIVPAPPVTLNISNCSYHSDLPICVKQLEDEEQEEQEEQKAQKEQEEQEEKEEQKEKDNDYDCDLIEMNIHCDDMDIDIDANTKNNTQTQSSNSSCSSRVSFDNNSDFESDVDSDFESKSQSQSNTNVADDDNDNDNEDDDNDDEDEDDDDAHYVTFPSFPVQLICIEQCEETLEDLFSDDDFSDEQVFAALMQVIMTLIAYQKMFDFTHNDLHSNNIMYTHTNEPYVYYMVNKQLYRVPTFGRIFKIIDFGRSIYKFKGVVCCSDCFQTGGDAFGQYNTEPFLNPNKPRIDPNFSFDLCRLGCSILDHFIDHVSELRPGRLTQCSPLTRVIADWCMDDNGINVLYKFDGTERYSNFKLYKMIARCVHKHTPQAQLERNEFKQYAFNKKKINKTHPMLLNIDELPNYTLP